MVLLFSFSFSGVDDDNNLVVGRGVKRQYVPPKCMVRRERSVRHVHFEGSLRNVRREASSVGVMKFSRISNPGTDVWIGIGRDADGCWMGLGGLFGVSKDGGNRRGTLAVGRKNSLILFLLRLLS